jgi:hypothetical protein
MPANILHRPKILSRIRKFTLKLAAQLSRKFLVAVQDPQAQRLQVLPLPSARRPQVRVVRQAASPPRLTRPQEALARNMSRDESRCLSPCQSVCPLFVVDCLGVSVLYAYFPLPYDSLAAYISFQTHLVIGAAGVGRGHMLFMLVFWIEMHLFGALLDCVIGWNNGAGRPTLPCHS